MLSATIRTSAEVGILGPRISKAILIRYIRRFPGYGDFG